MTMKELGELKVGDLCTIIRGHDAGRLCEVAYIEGESVLVRSADGKRFNSLTKYGKLRLTSWRELKIVKKKLNEES